MTALQARFKDRLKEVDHYLGMLEAVESELVHNRVSWRHGRKHLPKVLSDDLSLKLLKANAFLLMYSFVEATVRDSIESIWEAVALSRTPAVELLPEMRDVWIGSEFRKKDSFSASGATYKDVASNILKAISRSDVPSVPFKRVGVGGNVNVETIADLCASHGVKFSAPKNTRGGTDLNVLKERRNILAHGEQSFEDVGSRNTVSDLKEMKVRVAVYLRQYVRRVDSYLEKTAYKAA